MLVERLRILLRIFANGDKIGFTGHGAETIRIYYELNPILTSMG